MFVEDEATSQMLASCLNSYFLNLSTGIENSEKTKRGGKIPTKTIHEKPTCWILSHLDLNQEGVQTPQTGQSLRVMRSGKHGGYGNGASQTLK